MRILRGIQGLLCAEIATDAAKVYSLTLNTVCALLLCAFPPGEPPARLHMAAIAARIKTPPITVRKSFRQLERYRLVVREAVRPEIPGVFYALTPEGDVLIARLLQYVSSVCSEIPRNFLRDFFLGVLDAPKTSTRRFPALIKRVPELAYFLSFYCAEQSPIGAVTIREKIGLPRVTAQQVRSRLHLGNLVTSFRSAISRKRGTMLKTTMWGTVVMGELRKIVQDAREGSA